MSFLPLSHISMCFLSYFFHLLYPTPYTFFSHNLIKFLPFLSLTHILFFTTFIFTLFIVYLSNNLSHFSAYSNRHAQKSLKTIINGALAMYMIFAHAQKQCAIQNRITTVKYSIVLYSQNILVQIKYSRTVKILCSIKLYDKI